MGVSGGSLGGQLTGGQYFVEAQYLWHLKWPSAKQTSCDGRIQNMDRGPWTTLWTTPWTTPNSQKEIAPVNMKIYCRSGYEKHILILIAYVLEGLSRNLAGCFESKALERVMLSGNLPPSRSCFV